MMHEYHFSLFLFHNDINEKLYHMCWSADKDHNGSSNKPDKNKKNMSSRILKSNNIRSFVHLMPLIIIINQSELVGDVAVPVSVRQAVLF